jgi:formate C-acetyltransferase
MKKGVSLEDARDYAPLGCVEIMIPGRSGFRTMCMGLNLPKVFELVLNQGRCLVTGDQVWTDIPDSYLSFEDLVETYHKKVEYIINLGIEIIREDERLESNILPRPWLTVLSHGGIASGIDLTAGQPKYDAVGVTLDGISDIVNALYSTKRLLNGRNPLSLHSVRKILQENWASKIKVTSENGIKIPVHALRQSILNRFPRYGQDNDEIIRIARDETDYFASCFEGKETYFGGNFWPMIFGVSTGLLYGKSPKTGALPSGRRTGEMLAMSLQPNVVGQQGCTTAILRSAALAVDGLNYPGGISNVQECDPSLVVGEKGLDRLTSLIDGFFDLGGVELSMNFLNEDMLRAAQLDPENYRFLMVRVFGLSAQFVNLSPELQETVINRVITASKRKQ